MIAYTLFIWTVVAHAHTYNPNMDWRPLTEVQMALPNGSEAACHDVARQLNIPKERYRCIRTK